MPAFNIDIVSQPSDRSVLVKSNGDTYLISVSQFGPELMVFKCNERGEVTSWGGVAGVGLPDDYHAGKSIAEYILESREAGEFVGSYDID